MPNHSQYLKNGGGKWYLAVEGEPFLFHCLQAPLRPGPIPETCFQNAAALGFPVLTIPVYWSYFETSQGSYCFNALDEALRMANLYQIRLDLLWSGVDFFTPLDSSYVPEWLLARHEWHVRGGDDHCAVGCKADPSDEDLYCAELKVLEAMVRHLRNSDASGRVISIQIEREYDPDRYAAPPMSTVIYINRLAGELKAFDDFIALRANIAEGTPSRSSSVYVADIQYTRRMLRSGEATRFRCAEENMLPGVLSANITEAFACGAFYSRCAAPEWREDCRLTGLNRSFGRAPAVIAEASPEDMKAFDSECKITLLGDTFTVAGSATGLIVCRGGRYYCFSDGDALLCRDGGGEIELTAGECVEFR